MATRGTIAVLHTDGTVKQIYSHWDNYLECNGLLLIEDWNSQERAESLVDWGDIASLEEGRVLDGGNLRPAVFDNLQDYIDNVSLQEYNYIYIDYGWFLFDPKQKKFRHGILFSSVEKLLEDAAPNLIAEN